MPQFEYKALDAKGNEKKGVLHALTQQDALEQLKQSHLFATELHETYTVYGRSPHTAERTTRFPRLAAFFHGRIKRKHIVSFTSDLSVLIESGIPIIRALTVLIDQVLSARLRTTIEDIRTDVESGQPLSDAVSKHPHAFVPLFVNMIRAGELGGVLSSVLNRLALLYEKQERLDAKIKAAMVYPVAVLFFAFTVVGFMMTVIVPKFFVMFDEVQAELPLLTRMLQGISIFVGHYWWLMVGALLLVMGGIKVIMRYKRIQYMRDGFLLQLPLFGLIFRKVSISRFCRVFGTLRASGVPILQTLSVAKDACGNLIIEQAIDKVKDSIREGESVAGPLSSYPVFPALVINMIAVGEETGMLSEMLIKIADRYDDEVDTLISQMTTLIEPVLIIGLGLIVLLIVLGLFLPLITLVDSFAM